MTNESDQEQGRAVNRERYTNGLRFMLAVSTANAARSQPRFAHNRSEAASIKSDLQGVGYVVTVFKILPNGGLTFA
jgi:hypothetical protein